MQAIEAFYFDAILPLVIQVRQPLTSRLHSLYKPLLSAIQDVPNSTAHFMLRHLQPSSNLLQFFQSGSQAQAYLMYRQVFMEFGNTAQSFDSEDAVVGWKRAHVTNRLMLLSSAPCDIIEGFKCDIDELPNVLCGAHVEAARLAQQRPSMATTTNDNDSYMSETTDVDSQGQQNAVDTVGSNQQLRIRLNGK